MSIGQNFTDCTFVTFATNPQAARVTFSFCCTEDDADAPCRRRRRGISHSGHTHSKFEYPREVDSPRVLDSPLPAVTKPHAKRIPREAVKEREREGGRKERAEMTAGWREGREYYMGGTWKGWESDRSSPVPCLLYFLSPPRPLSLSLSFSSTFSPFFTKPTLIFIRITKNNATHRHPWPVESRPSNADYGGLQVYNWISMRERPPSPPSSPSQASDSPTRHGNTLKNSISQSYRKQRALFSEQLEPGNMGHLIIKKCGRSIRNRISISLSKLWRHVIGIDSITGIELTFFRLHARFWSTL